MKLFATLCFVMGLAMMPVPAAPAVSLPWQWLDPIAAEALLAFRQSDHGIAESINMNLDGENLDQSADGLRPMNFDPSRHLAYIVADLNGDRRPEVFLLFEWHFGNQPSPGVVMQRIGERWHIICDIELESRYSVSIPRGGDRMIRNRVVLLDRRSHGWRHFRIHAQRYGWKPAPQGGGLMECVPRGS